MGQSNVGEVPRNAVRIHIFHSKLESALKQLRVDDC